MAAFPLRMILALLLPENNDLAAARFPDDRRHHTGAIDRRNADLRLVATDHEHFIERDFVLLGVAEDVALDDENVAFFHAILLSTGANDGEQSRTSEKTVWNRVNRGFDGGYSVPRSRSTVFRTWQSR